MNYFDKPYDRLENILSEDYVIGTYLVTGVAIEKIIDASGKFAVGQTVGTWVELPGTTRYMIDNYQARMISVFPVEDTNGDFAYIMNVGFPIQNFGESFAMLQTAMIGNDVSTALNVKLLDLSFSRSALGHFTGPKQGIDGVREICGVYDRPLVLNMIKPCIGHTPDEAAKLFYETGLGGIDLIKDDEVHGETPISSAFQRAVLFNKTAESVFEETGKKPIYVPNITSTPKKTLENAKAVYEAGCKMVMLNFATAGLDLLRELSNDIGNKLCILGHYAGFGMMSSSKLGYSESVMLGLLPRLAGADMVMTMFPPSNIKEDRFNYIRTLQMQQLPLDGIKKVMTTIGGGVTPLNVESIIRDVGKDVILAAGGSVYGHPLGARGGARAMMQSVEAAIKGISIQEAAKQNEELKLAIEAWG